MAAVSFIYFVAFVVLFQGGETADPCPCSVIVPEPTITNSPPEYDTLYRYVGVFVAFGAFQGELVPDTFKIYITAQEADYVVVEGADGTTMSQAVTAGTTTVINWSSAIATLGAEQTAAFEVRSNTSLTVTALASSTAGGTDAATLLQTRTKGFFNYVLPVDTSGLVYSYVAVEENTTVTSYYGDMPTQSCDNGPSQVNILQRLETFTIGPLTAEASTCVTADKPLFIFVSRGCDDIPYQGVTGATCSHLYEQLLPLNMLGMEYLLPHLNSDPLTPETYVVTATSDSTVMITSGKTDTTSRLVPLLSGQSYQFDVDPESTSFVKCSEKCSVLGFHQRSGSSGSYLYQVPPVTEQSGFYFHQSPLINAAGDSMSGSVTIIRSKDQEVMLDGTGLTGFTTVVTAPSLEMKTIDLMGGEISVNGSGAFSTIYHGNNGTEALGTFSPIYNEYDYCADSVSCTVNETCLNPCYGSNEEDCRSDISDGYVCVDPPSLDDYQLSGWIVAPAKVKVFLDGKRRPIQIKEVEGWSKPGEPFNITMATSIVGIKLVDIREPRRDKEQLLMLAAFDCGRLKTKGGETDWEWKCTDDITQVGSGYDWLLHDFDDSTWETPSTLSPNQDVGSKEFPFIHKLYQCDPEAEYIWISNRGGGSELVIHCRAKPQ